MKTNSLILSVLLSLSQTNIIFCASQNQNTPAQRPGLFGSMTKGAYCGALTGASLYGIKYGAQLINRSNAYFADFSNTVNSSTELIANNLIHTFIEKTAKFTDTEEFICGCFIVAACSTLYFTAQSAANAHEKFGYQKGLKEGLQERKQTDLNMILSNSEELLKRINSLLQNVNNNNLATKEVIEGLKTEVQTSSNNLMATIIENGANNLKMAPVTTSPLTRNDYIQNHLFYRINDTAPENHPDAETLCETAITAPQDTITTNSSLPNYSSWFNLNFSDETMTAFAEAFLLSGASRD